MFTRFKLYTLEVCFISLFLHGVFTQVVEAAELAKQKDSGSNELQRIINDLKKAVITKDFTILKTYSPRKEPVGWGPCQSDVGFDLTIDEMIRVLSDQSKNAVIQVNEKPAEGLIETEGWTGEYPYLYFSFNKTNGQWEWHGICHAVRRTQEFLSLSGIKEEEAHNRHIQLPRPGPRIFKDRLALEARVEEILRFNAFDALKPYATKGVITLGKCSRDALINDKIDGKEVAIEQLIDFLEKNAQGAKEIKPSGHRYYKYLETEGWSTEYPYISFWFTESQTGWQWTGVTYCKVGAMELKFPDEPGFKKKLD